MKLSLKAKLYDGYVYILFAVIFISIVLFVNFFRDTNSIEASNLIYYSCLSIGYAFAYSAIIYLITYVPLSLICSTRKIPGLIFTIVAILFQIFIVIDVFVFAIYKFHLDGNAIKFYMDAGSDVFVFDLKLKIGIGVVWFLTSILPYSLVHAYSNKLSKILNTKRVNILTTIFLLMFISSNVTYIFARKHSMMPLIKSTECLPVFPSEFFKNISSRWKTPEAAYIDDIMLETPDGKIKYPLTPLVSEDIDKKYNIIMILIDSWNIRAFDEETTPSMYNFSKSAQRFDQHFTGSNATDGSVFSIFYSLPYSYHDAAERDKAYPVLFNELKKQNYDIDIFSSAYLVLQSTVFGELRDSVAHFTEGGSAMKQDIKITDKAIDFINKQDGSRPFFSLVFYDLAHAISIPEEYRQKFTPSWSETNYIALNNDMDPTPFFNLYRNCLYFIDGQVDRIFKELEAKGMLDNTIVIVTGDHGQEFNESKQNNWGHSSNYSNWQIQVPFILHDPRNPKQAEHKHVTTHYDIVPTLMNGYLGVKNPIEEYSLGQMLESENDRYPFWSGGSGEFKVRTSLVLQDFLVTAEHGLGLCFVTDRNLNPLPNSILDDYKDTFNKAREQKERFHEKK